MVIESAQQSPIGLMLRVYFQFIEEFRPESIRYGQAITVTPNLIFAALKLKPHVQQTD